MLKSLFGDLYPSRSQPIRRSGETDFVATAILEHVSGEMNEAGQIVDRHEQDLFVIGSAAQAMRAHYTSVQENVDPTQRNITLLDPTRMWAGAVVRALSDASGQPIERLHLREQASLATLAMIERTTLSRRQEETLKVYHADVRTPGSDGLAIPMALMERSDLAVILIGPLSPTAIDQLLASVLNACRSTTWRCPHLLFMLPVGALWIASKVSALPWPASMQVDSLCEPLTSASTVWNKLLAHWARLKTRPTAERGRTLAGTATTTTTNTPATPTAADGFFRLPPAPTRGPGVMQGLAADTGFGPMQTLPATTGHTQFGTLPAETAGSAITPMRLHLPAVAPEAPADPGVSASRFDLLRTPPERRQAEAILNSLAHLDGVIFTALVELDTGLVLASNTRGPDVDRAAAAASDVLRAHANSLRLMGHPRPGDPVDEVLVTAGSRYHIIRTLQAHPSHFLLAVLDKLRSNLAMTRFRVMEAQQQFS
ncbi:hypothetical protein C7444_103290 [Sphaerotilus hippei]|uniref:Roadblock/LAMTOR2 domain-containing protein n=1 Tax=Sphaerotilus hippei TaxID=744406 RepID=A0A318H8I0_9BURK|nr:roadblock/LC7 domain-containing protein [Sphaerotilus hippei]PXW98192.1 hypothetical protein C7444_103290 [Sphaerotilus hippei]